MKLIIDTLAEVLHLSRYYLAHFFKEHTGLSIGQYITNIRMNKATELLRQKRRIYNEYYLIVWLQKHKVLL